MPVWNWTLAWLLLPLFLLDVAIRRLASWLAFSIVVEVVLIVVLLFGAGVAYGPWWGILGVLLLGIVAGGPPAAADEEPAPLEVEVPGEGPIQVELRLEEWDEGKEYDRHGLDRERTEIIAARSGTPRALNLYRGHPVRGTGG